MNKALETGLYFPSAPKRLDLFQRHSSVTDILNSLKGWLSHRMVPNVPGKIAPMIPLDRHWAMIDGEWTTQGFGVCCDSRTKGRPRVVIDGTVREECALLCAGALLASPDLEIGPGATVEPGAMIKGPGIIGPGCDIRQGAYVRGDVLFEAKCVIGHTTEVKHSIFLKGAKAGHFAYVGDSILGQEVNLGAGTKLANLRFAPGNVRLQHEGKQIDTGRRKLGAILGDRVQTGCNSVTNPGTLMAEGGIIAAGVVAGPGIFPPGAVLR